MVVGGGSRSVRRHEAAGHAYRRHRPHRDRDVRSLLAAFERNLRRRASRRRGRKIRRRVNRHAARRGRGRRNQHAIQRQQSDVAHLLRARLAERRHLGDAREKELAPQRRVRRFQERGRHGGLRGGHEDDVRPGPQLREPEHAAIVSRRGRHELGNDLHAAVAGTPGDDVFDERPDRDADDRFAGFVHHRAGNDTVLPHPERDVRGPLALGERQELVLAPGPALAVRPGRIAFLRGLHEVLARRQIREEEAAVAVRHHATLRRCRQVSGYFGIVSLTMASPTGVPVAASTTWPTIIPVRWPGGAPSVGMTCAEPRVVRASRTTSVASRRG